MKTDVLLLFYNITEVSNEKKKKTYEIFPKRFVLFSLAKIIAKKNQFNFLPHFHY